MREIDILEAKNTLDTLLDQVQGTEITIVRHGIAIAKLIRAEPSDSRATARAAAEDLRALAHQISGPPLTWDELRRCRDEGRR